MQNLNHRHGLGTWLNENNLVGFGVEVGSLHGSYAKIILDSWKGNYLTMVDPWATQLSGDYRESTNTETDFSAAYKLCQEIARSFPRRVSLLRHLSLDAAPQFGDGSLDFVYLDGNHSYEAVLADLDAWYPKVKPGGLFGGHDYLNDVTTPGWDCEVKRALDEWCAPRNLVPHLTSCTSWWILK